MKVPRFELPEGKEQLQEFFTSNKPIMYDLLLSSISFAMNNKLESTKVIDFWWEDNGETPSDDGEYSLIIEKENYMESLYNCLLWFEEKELYEKCSQTKKLIDKLT